jgi:hypothetical protein
LKIYDIQPTLDNPSLSRIRFPTWLKCLYNVSQIELTTLGPLGAFYLVALDEDWDVRPEHLNQQNQIRPRPQFSQPPMYAANAPAAAIASYNISSRPLNSNTNNEFVQIFTRPSRVASEPWRSSPSTSSIALAPDHSPLTNNLVRELKSMFGTIIKHEIDATQAAIMAPLVLFANFRDSCSSMTQNYEFLTSCGHNIFELTRIDNFLSSIQAWSQFDSYVTTWRTDISLNQRTLASIQQYFLDQYGDMPG